MALSVIPPPLQHPVIGQDGKMTVPWASYFRSLATTVDGSGYMLQSVYDPTASGSVVDSNELQGQPGSYYLDLGNATGIASPSSLGTGTADSTTFLRGDGVWETISGPSWNSTTIDFGATPISDSTFTIVDASCTSTSVIEFAVSGADTTATNDANSHMQASLLFVFSATPSAGQFSLDVGTMFGFVTGEFVIKYRVGA